MRSVFVLTLLCLLMFTMTMDVSAQEKSPFLAGSLSASLPGLGQLYNGQPGKALLHLGVEGAIHTGALILLVSSVDPSQPGEISEQRVVGITLGWIAGALIWRTYSIFEARGTARRINEELKAKVPLNISVQNKDIGIQVSYSF